jgi:hypothetical protein
VLYRHFELVRIKTLERWSQENEVPEPEVRIRRTAPLDRSRADNSRTPWQYEDDDEVVDLMPYIHAIASRWRTLVAAASSAGAITAVITGLMLPKWYRAAAIIRPISTPAIENRITGVMGALGGGLGGLAASLSGSQSNDAEEYIAILNGFQFNVNLAKGHQLSNELLKPGLLGFLLGSKPKDPKWAIYRALQKRFDCDYSIKTGNITLDFQAENRADAERILEYYIDDLHELLRTREVKGTSSAIESLEEEARSTPDPMLRAELYDLVAKQVQHRKMAEVEADFAFRVLDPPAASDRPYRPRVVLDCTIAALLVSLFAASIFLFDTELAEHSARRTLYNIADGEDVTRTSNGAPAK